MRNLLVTGGAGFIGSSFVRIAINAGYKVIVLDKLTYAGHIENLAELKGRSESFEFVQGDICDAAIVNATIQKFQIDAVVNFAAETHVDNSILGPSAFVQTNVFGTFTLLEAVRKVMIEDKKSLRFVHVSTDEVFGELGLDGKFSESSPYDPSSPYSATKAASDHLVRAWERTYGLDALVTNCSNNYGPRQFPEKLIPKVILNALKEKPLPVYGKGENIRDWIFVDDHSHGVLRALEVGKKGGTYCLGGNSERKNIDVVQGICSVLDEVRPRKNGHKYSELIEFVTDRPGHDFRYAIDDKHAASEIGFKREVANFEHGLKKTIEWYLSNQTWIDSVTCKGTKG